ncbi:MAG: hypothetical protein ACI9HK_004683 [Pirellulaceae bacterium]|jgi:hypothetical protein
MSELRHSVPYSRKATSYLDLGDGLLKVREYVTFNEQLDCSTTARFARDETAITKSDDHVVNRGWRRPKVPLHVRFGRRLSVELRVVVDKRKILPLFSSWFV